MTDQEKINAEVQMKLAMQDAKFNVFMQEMRDFKAEMRDRDNQRATENHEIRTSLQNMQNNMQNMQASSRNLNIVTILSIAAIVIAVLLK